MNAKSKWACLFSLRLLVGDGWAYLWTLTTPDAVDLKELSRRWRKLIWNGFKPCVRVFERHPGGHGYHVHFVTSERLAVTNLRLRTAQAGFGRIHVRRIPGERAGYVAKYLTKQHGCPGVRMWGCVDFKGVPVGRLKSKSTTDYVAHPEDGALAKVDAAFTQYVWNAAGQDEHRVRVRTVQGEEKENIRRFHITQESMETLRAEFLGGMLLSMGVYRGLRVVTKSVRDVPTKSSHETVRIEHLVEIAGNLRLVTEWPSKGTVVKDIIPPAASYTLVKVYLQEIRKWRGETYLSGTVVPLSSSATDSTGGQMT